MTVKDDKKLRTMNTMSAGKSQSSISQYDRIVLHGANLVNVIVTDSSDTIAQYENGAQRVFNTYDLASFIDLGAFPSGTAFHRRTEKGIESLFIEQVNSDTYIVEKVVLGKSVSETISYADLMAWHTGGEKVDPSISLVPGTHLYVPKTTLGDAEAQTTQPESDPDEADDDQPFESELNKRIEQLEAELAAVEVAGQKRINELTSENFKLKQAIQQQVTTHATVIAGYEEDLARLEAKAAIVTSVCKEYCIKYDIKESTLNQLANDGWQIQHMQFMTDPDFAGQLNVVFFRDLPASPAPKVAVTDAAIYSTAAVPAVRPPMLANQTVILNQPVSRALTNNGPKPGETKRIPTLASIEARRERDAAEIDTILQRGRDRQEILRRTFASQPSPFPVAGE